MMTLPEETLPLLRWKGTWVGSRSVTAVVFLLVGVACLLLPCCSSSSSSFSSNSSSLDDAGYKNLVNWIIDYGGRVDPRIHVQLFHDGRGLVALEDLNEGTELLFCPWDLILGAGGTDRHNNKKKNDEAFQCKVVEDLIHELELGHDSFWYPYLMSIGELPRLLSRWDSVALQELQGLFSVSDATRYERWFDTQCRRRRYSNSNDEGVSSVVESQHHHQQQTAAALISYVSRASQVGMIPLYDLINHHNGHRNVKLQVSDAGAHLYVVVSTISAGDELYLSYGMKTASTVFLNYGFIEAWPTCWNFALDRDNFAFCIFPDRVVAIHPTLEFYQQVWQTNLTLVDHYQTWAVQHMETISDHDLIRFGQATQMRLAEFPTTLQDDESWLLQNNAASSGLHQTQLEEDVTSAIKYRYAFKTAVHVAWQACEQLLLQRQQQQSSSSSHEL